MAPRKAAGRTAKQTQTPKPRPLPAREARASAPAAAPLPDRFTIVSEGRTAGVLLRDTETGHEARVKMAAWEEVRRVLRALFPPEQTETTSAAPVASAKSLKVARTNNKRAAGKAKPPAAAADARPGPGAGKNKPPAPTLPTGFEPEILGKGFRLVYGKDPMTNRDAYRVEVNGQDVGWLRKEDERRWVLYSPSDAFPQSIHRNVLGAHTRIETIYEPRD